MYNLHENTIAIVHNHDKSFNLIFFPSELEEIEEFNCPYFGHDNNGYRWMRLVKSTFTEFEDEDYDCDTDFFTVLSCEMDELIKLKKWLINYLLK